MPKLILEFDLSKEVEAMLSMTLLAVTGSAALNTHVRGPRAALHSAPRATAACATGTALPAVEAAKLFGRFAERVLFLDAAIGACCHSACDDCEWRDPGGGYRFDLLRANNPKWLPCYFLRDFKDERGSHAPRWAATLFPGGADSTVGRADFDARIAALEYGVDGAAPMGPKGKPDESPPAPETLDALWAYLTEAVGAESLAAADARRRLQDMSPDEDRAGAIGEGPDFVDWKGFARALGAPPFERW